MPGSGIQKNVIPGDRLQEKVIPGKPRLTREKIAQRAARE